MQLYVTEEAWITPTQRNEYACIYKYMHLCVYVYVYLQGEHKSSLISDIYDIKRRRKCTFTCFFFFSLFVCNRLSQVSPQIKPILEELEV